MLPFNKYCKRDQFKAVSTGYVMDSILSITKS